MKDNHDTEYMTSGQLAKDAGVTLRTLRFYDQKGILIPAAKGPGNIRYYTQKERERLYEILCYKFMGMSLEEIRKKLEENTTPETVGQTLHQKVAETEENISKQMRQYAVMKDLEALSGGDQKLENWTAYAEVIDFIKVKWDMIWQLNKAFASGMTASPAPSGSSEEMKQYYQLMADVLQKMNQGADPESEEMMEIMQRYFEMHPDEMLISVDPDIMRIRGDNASDLWIEIKEYMKRAATYYFDNRKTQD